jgi:hypothetical protein
MKKELIKLRSYLKTIGLAKEANYVRNLIKKAEEDSESEDDSYEYNNEEYLLNMYGKDWLRKNKPHLVKDIPEDVDCKNCDGDTFFREECYDDMSWHGSFDKSDEAMRRRIQEIKSKEAAEGLAEALDDDFEFISFDFIKNNFELIREIYKQFLSNADYVNLTVRFFNLELIPQDEIKEMIFEMDPEQFVKNYSDNYSFFLKFGYKNRPFKFGEVLNQLCLQKLKEYAMSVNENNVKDFKETTRDIVVEQKTPSETHYHSQYFDIHADNGASTAKEAVEVIESTLSKYTK